MRYLILDVASAPIADAADYLDKPTPDGRLTDPAKIAKDIAEKHAALTDRAGLDLDLARITAIGMGRQEGSDVVLLCKTEDDERGSLSFLAGALRDEHGALRSVISYNGHAFDLPLLQRRARYLGVSFPKLSTDRYKSTNIDLLLELTDRDQKRMRPLGFYAKRLHMGLTKPLSGDAESRVHQTGQWDELAASVRHDLEATRRLAEWLGLLPRQAVA